MEKTKVRNMTVLIIGILAFGFFTLLSHTSLAAPTKQNVNKNATALALSGGTLSCPGTNLPTASLLDKAVTFDGQNYLTNWNIYNYNPNGTFINSYSDFTTSTRGTYDISAPAGISMNNNGIAITTGNMSNLSSGNGNEDGIMLARNIGAIGQNWSEGGALSTNPTVYPVTGVALDNSNNLYQVDNQGLIYKWLYTATNPACPVGSSNCAYGQGTQFIDARNAVAIAANNGNIYVLKDTTGNLTEYNSSGAVIMTAGGGRTNIVGFALDGNSNIYLVNNTGTVYAYNSAGAFVLSFGGGRVGVVGVGVDGTGNIYVTDTIGVVFTYSSTGTLLGSFGGGKSNVIGIAGGCRITP